MISNILKQKSNLLDKKFHNDIEFKKSISKIIDGNRPNLEDRSFLKLGKQPPKLSDAKIWQVYHDKMFSESLLEGKQQYYRSFYTKGETINDNINHIQDVLNEFVCQYYVYKNNMKSDIVGFCQYGKFFSHNSEFIYGGDRYKINPSILNLTDLNGKCVGLAPYLQNDNTFMNILQKTNDNFYQLLLNYITEKYPEKRKRFISCFNNIQENVLMRFESYICKWDDFCKYMEFVLGLFEFNGFTLNKDTTKESLMNNINFFLIDLYENEPWYFNNPRRIAYFLELLCSVYWHIFEYDVIFNYVPMDSKTNIQEKFYTATCTIIKDEMQYLEEWIQHNIKIGFDEIWLYEDYGSCSHKSITDKYPQVTLKSIGEVESAIGEFKTWFKQHQTWEYFVETYKNKFDYVAFIDIDEFIMFDDGYDLQRILHECYGYSGIYLFWKMYNANGIIDNPHASVVDTFTEEAKYIRTDYKWEIKSIVNMKYHNLYWNTNHEIKDGITLNKDMGYKYPCYKKAWINHYFTRSWEEWVDRFIKRGDINDGCRRMNEFFKFNKNMIGMYEELMRKKEEYIEIHNKNKKSGN